MKTPYYSGTFTAAQHSGLQDDDQLRERMLEHRLANRDDVRDIWIVTALPFSERLKNSPAGKDLVKKASKNSKSDLSWAMHWAVQVGDQYFELQRGYPDPLRTGLRMSKWDEQKQSQIHQRYRQGTTAMTDEDIKAVGERYFSRLDRIDLNIYSVWCNNCQVAVDCMLRDIGGLFYYRAKIESLHEMVKQFFYDSILSITQMYGRYRGWNEEVITKYTVVLHKTLRVMTSRSEYPKRHWIREDIESADGVIKKVGTVKDHWLLTVLETSLSLRKPSEDLYVRRGLDGKPELNFEALREATKGIFDENEKKWHLAWLKAVPYLTGGYVNSRARDFLSFDPWANGGHVNVALNSQHTCHEVCVFLDESTLILSSKSFIIGTPRWAAAVISIALSRASQLHQERVGLKNGLEGSLASLGVSPNPQNPSSTYASRPNLRNQRTMTNGQRRVKSKTLSVDDKFHPRYERCLTATGVPYFIDHMSKTRSWDAPGQQEMCLKIINPPLSRRWEEKQEEGRTIYVNRISGATIDSRPGPSEIWAVKKRISPPWVKSTTMATPCGWETRRTEEGEMYYTNHNDHPPTTTSRHPMRQEIEDERRVLLPEWNVEWDNDRGKKYRNIQSGEIRWKSVDGPQQVVGGEKARITLGEPQEGFIEPLPPTWTMTVDESGRRIYKNGKVGRDRLERTTHPLEEKRRRLHPEWEMRYTSKNRRYWVHHGEDGRGTTWWTRNRLLKNTSLKNNASGWKLAQNGLDWEWFEGGDVPHSEIPVLDLDDPADIEFREYPFILPARLTTSEGAFIEPLPTNWVIQIHEDGSPYYWNFKDEVRLDYHPNEEERKHLPALWEMRFTRHGRKYFVHHEDGSTWWTHPGRDKHERKQRAPPGQSQNGWKLSEDGKSWGKFEDHPDAECAENNLLHAESNQNDTLGDGNDAEKWRSISFTRAWLKKANASGVITTARARIPKSTKSFRRSENSPSIDSTLEESKQEISEDEDAADEDWLADSHVMTEEPQSSEDLAQEEPLQNGNIKRSWPPIHNPRDVFKKTQELARVASNLLESPQGILDEEGHDKREPPKDLEPVIEDPTSTVEEAHITSSPQKEVRKAWGKRTTSHISALKTKIGKKGSQSGFSLPHGKVKSEIKPEPAVQGLGITNPENVDLGGGASVLFREEEHNGLEDGLRKVVDPIGNENVN